MRRARWKRKNVSAGRSAQAQPSCRRRGMAGGPARQSGTETPGPWGILRPGEVQGYILHRFPLPLTLPRRTRQRLAKRKARKEKQIKSVYHPDDFRTIRHGSAASTSQKMTACPKASPNRRLHRYADPRQRGGQLHRSASKAPFSFGPCTARFLFRKTEKKMGGASPLDKPPWREPDPRGRRNGGPCVSGGGSRNAGKFSPAGRCVPADNPW